MDPVKSECYEFLDLSDVDDSERSQLKESLFGNPPPDYLLHLPWVSDHHSNSIETNSNASTQYSEPVYNQQWGVQHPSSVALHQYGDNSEHSGRDSPSVSVVSTGGSSGIMSPHSTVGGNGVQQPHVYSSQPMYAPMQPPPPGPVPPGTPMQPTILVNNVTANLNYAHYVHPYYVPQQYIQPQGVPPPEQHDMRQNPNNQGRGGRIRSRNTSRPRHQQNDESSQVNSPYVPSYMPYPAYIPSIHQMHPSAQHAQGSNLYITPPVFYSYPGPQGFYSPQMQVNTEYQYQTEPHHHTVQEQPPIDSHGRGDVGSNPYPTNPQSQNLVTTVTVSHDQSNSKKTTSKTQVQIKQNIRKEQFETAKPQVVVMTPAPEVINGTASCIEKKTVVKVKVPKTSPAIISPDKVEKITEPVPVAEIEPVPVEEILPVVKQEPRVEELNVESLTITAKVPKKKSNVSSVVKPTTQVQNQSSEKVPISIKPKEIFSTVLNQNESQEIKPPSEPKPEIEIIEEPDKIEPEPVVTNNSQKSWASLFKARSEAANKTAETLAILQPSIPTPPSLPKSEPESSTNALNNSGIQTTKPLARVSPFDKTVVNDKEVKNKPEKTTSLFEDPNAHRMGEFLLKYSIDNRTVSLLPRGLTNRSIFCYVNSILQAFLACPPFCNLMQALAAQKNDNQRCSTPIIDCMLDFIQEFTPLPAGARIGRRERTGAAAAAAAAGTNGNKTETTTSNDTINCGPAVDPACVYRAINKIRGDSFSADGRQEDAEEFLGCLLNALNDEMVELMKLVDDVPNTPKATTNGITNNTNKNDNNNIEDDDEWTVMGPKNKGSVTRRADFGRSPISDIFRGQIRSRIQRAGHQQSTDNVQPFFTLQLDIEKTNSVKEALELLAGKNILEGVTCSKTQQAVEAWQQVSIEELPLVLILHLKCFNYERRGCTKIIKNVEFPVDLKIDSKLISPNKKYTNKQKQYKLFAVVYHDGKEAYIGHYITDAFHVGYGGWVRYDDSTVRGVPESHVLRPRAPRMPYLLYYRRCDTIGNQQQSTNQTGGSVQQNRPKKE